MNPHEILQTLLKVNKPVAQFVFAGLGLLAAAVLVTSWLGENPGLGLIAAYILGFAVLVTLITFVVTNDRMRLVLGWAMTSVMIVFMVGLVGSTFQIPPSLPLPACYVKILWVHPEKCEADLIDDEMVWRAAPELTGIWMAQANTAEGREAPYEGPIFLHYAPGNEQGAMVQLALNLGTSGWPVRGAEGGGEEIAASPNTTQIRYFSPDAYDDAVALARAVKALSGAEGVLVRDFSRSGLIADDKLLEIWISAPGNAT